jgi:hypothetical protein
MSQIISHRYIPKLLFDEIQCEDTVAFDSLVPHRLLMMKIESLAENDIFSFLPLSPVGPLVSSGSVPSTNLPTCMVSLQRMIVLNPPKCFVKDALRQHRVTTIDVRNPSHELSRLVRQEVTSSSQNFFSMPH